MTTVPETQTGQTFYRNFILFCLNVIICCTTFRDVIFRGTRHGVHKSWSKHEVTFFQWLPEKMCRIYSVSEKNWFPSRFLKLFPNGLEFLSKILHAYCMFISTPNYKNLFIDFNTQYQLKFCLKIISRWWKNFRKLQGDKNSFWLTL